MMSRKLLPLLLVTVGLALAACNTVRGVGQDLQSVADEVDQET
jgi:predicted small secreted protein